jgi:hypothetical protein
LVERHDPLYNIGGKRQSNYLSRKRMKKTIAALLLGGCAIAAQAEVVVYEFSFTGLERHRGYGSGTWDPTATISGRFVGEDLDGNGTIVGEELSSISLSGNRIGSIGFDNGETLYVSPEYRAGLYFSYVPGGMPTFNAYTTEYHPQVIQGTSIALFGGQAESSWYSDELIIFYSSTAQTKFISSIPEPSTAVMTFAGLALIGLAARRRKNR